MSKLIEARLTDEEIMGLEVEFNRDPDAIDFPAWVAKAAQDKLLRLLTKSDEELDEAIIKAVNDATQKVDYEVGDADAPIKVTDYVTDPSKVVTSLRPLLSARIHEAERKARAERMSKPCKVICLCGSTRFTKEMLIIQWNFTKQGHVVLSWCALPDDYYTGADKAHVGDQEGVKETVDEVHKRKIDLADEVYVVNIGGYIGDSTTSEIKYAMAHGKPVKYLEPEWEYPFMRQALTGGESDNEKA